MQREMKKTKITIREDWPISIASQVYGSNIDGCAFNISYVVKRNPTLAVEVLRLLSKCRELRNQPVLDNEEKAFAEASDKLNTLMKGLE